MLILSGCAGLEARLCLRLLLIDVPKPWSGAMSECSRLFSFALANRGLRGEAPPCCRACEEQV